MTFEEAKAHLNGRFNDGESVVDEDGDLFCLGWYVSWKRGGETITLDAEFTLTDLRAIVAVMESGA